jgi:hypothetical protein
MSRAAFQVLVIPFRLDQTNREPEYLLFRRAERAVWQWIAGGIESIEGEVYVDGSTKHKGRLTGRMVVYI